MCSLRGSVAQGNPEWVRPSNMGRYGLIGAGDMLDPSMEVLLDGSYGRVVCPNPTLGVLIGCQPIRLFHEANIPTTAFKNKHNHYEFVVIPSCLTRSINSTMSHISPSSPMWISPWIPKRSNNFRVGDSIQSLTNLVVCDNRHVANIVFLPLMHFLKRQAAKSYCNT